MNKYLEKIAAIYVGNKKKYVDTFTRRVIGKGPLKPSADTEKSKVIRGDARKAMKKHFTERADKAYNRLKEQD